MRNLDKQRGYHRKWRDANREEINARRRARYKATPAKRRNRWDKLNPDKACTRARNRRARKRLAEGTHTAADLFAIRALQNNRCEACKEDLGTGGHVDHIIPLARGGSNSPHNLQWLCKKCNLSKGAKDPRFQLIFLYYRRDDHAPQGRLEPENSEREHQDRERGGETAETGGRNSPR